MAKARKVKGIRCADPAVENARKIVDVRLEEMLSFSGAIYDRRNIEDIHNLRIAAKRLRYTLEMFTFAFPKGLKPLIKEVKEIQEHIGDMRDADVMIERVQTILDRKQAERSEKLHDIAMSIGRGTVAQRRQRIKSAMVTPTGTRDELAYYTLIAHKAEESDRAYQRFLTAWERMEATDFPGRLRQFVGLDAASGDEGTGELPTAATREVPEPVPDQEQASALIGHGSGVGALDGPEWHGQMENGQGEREEVPPEPKQPGPSSDSTDHEH